MKTRPFKYTEHFTTKNWKFLDNSADIFHISAQNIDCGYSLELHRGSSNESPKSMFFWRNKKNNVYPCKPQFYYIKVGVKIIYACFCDGMLLVYTFVFYLSLRGMDTSGRCFTIFCSGRQLLWFSVCFTACKVPSEKGFTLSVKN